MTQPLAKRPDSPGEPTTPGLKWVVFLAAAATLIGSGYLLVMNWRPD